MEIKSAIFDMDGTLLDSMHMWKNLGLSILVSKGIEPKPEVWNKVITMSLKDSIVYCKKTYGLVETIEQMADDMRSEMEHFFSHEVKLKPGVEKFLSFLKMQGVGMYVATNTERTLAESALRHTKIESYFQGLVTCPEVGKGKRDSPEVYEQAMEKLCSNKKDTVIFEDALHAIRTAKYAGFRVVAIYDKGSEGQKNSIIELADRYIYSFEELLESKN